MTVCRFIGLVNLAPAVHRALNEPNTRDAAEADMMDAMEATIRVDEEFPALAENPPE